MWKFLLVNFFVFIFSVVILLVMVRDFDPLSGDRVLALSVFSLALFWVMVSFMTFFFFFVQELIKGSKLGLRKFQESFRMGIITALAGTCLVLLQYFRMLGIIEFVLVILFFILFESFWRALLKN